MSRRTTTLAFFAVIGSAMSASAQTAPAEPEPTPAPEAPPASAPPPPPPSGSPPPEYYIETPGRAPEGAATSPAPPPPAPPPRVQVYEPIIPGEGPIYEPPPPPEPRHVAPKTALWVGARLGWFIPFGNLYARYGVRRDYVVYEGVPWSDFASSGAMLELNAGLRLGRSYTLFALWERAQLGSGDVEITLADGTAPGAQDGAETDFYGIGLRANSDPNHTGFVTEVALGYRRARTHFEDESELQLTDGILEGRLGVGAEFRISPSFSISPLVTLGVGSFGTIEFKRNSGQKFKLTTPNDESDGHAWATFQVGGHFDLFSSN